MRDHPAGDTGSALRRYLRSVCRFMPNVEITFVSPKHHRHVALSVVVASVAAMVIAGTATPATPTSGTCSFPSLSQLFSALGDSNTYFQGPNGDLEGSMSGWSLAGDAGVVEGNESEFVGSWSDSHSLALPTTSSSFTTQRSA